jgi:hypothetical protein
MTLVVTLIKMNVGGNFDSDLDNAETYRCDEPRQLYTPYTGEIYKDTTHLSRLDCSESRGVLGNSTCIQIQGCSWTTPSLNWYQYLFGAKSANATCVGQINDTYYGLNTSNDIFGSKYVDESEYSKWSDDVTLCSDPVVISNQTKCELFSCTWQYGLKISSIDMKQLSVSASFGDTMLLSIVELVSFRFDFEIENAFVNFFLNLLIFWLPLIILMGGIYTMVRA